MAVTGCISLLLRLFDLLIIEELEVEVIEEEEEEEDGVIIFGCFSFGGEGGA